MSEDGFRFHPLANIFPLMGGDEFAALQQDVAEHGVREPIVLHDGLILDGRNRYRASRAAGVDCPSTVYDGADPVAYVVSLNLRRRHLDELQRAMVAAKLANLEHGGVRGKSPIGDLLEPFPAPAVSQSDAASMLNVGKRSVERAREVIDEGAPENPR